MAQLVHCENKHKATRWNLNLPNTKHDRSQTYERNTSLFSATQTRTHGEKREGGHSTKKTTETMTPKGPTSRTLYLRLPKKTPHYKTPPIHVFGVGPLERTKKKETAKKVKLANN